MVTYGFFNSVEGDRKYDADQMSEYFEGLIGNGVYASVGNALAVEPDEGMNVRVLSGRGVINCKWLSNDAAVSLPITGSDPSYDRYTAVVMRLDVDNRLMELDTIDGTPAAEPVKPTLTQSELIYELCLAWVRVNAGDVSVEEANITDARPTEDCGWVTGLITQQDVSDLTSDIYDELHTYAAGDYCIKDNTLQKNIVPTNPPEVWDPTHWEATNVGDELTEIKSNLIEFKTLTGTTDGSGNLAVASTDINPTTHMLLMALPQRDTGYETGFYTCKIGTNQSKSNYTIMCINDTTNAKLTNKSVKVIGAYVKL